MYYIHAIVHWTIRIDGFLNSISIVDLNAFHVEWTS